MTLWRQWLRENIGRIDDAGDTIEGDDPKIMIFMDIVVLGVDMLGAIMRSVVFNHRHRRVVIDAEGYRILRQLRKCEG